YGITNLGEETISSITIHGPATMNGTKILELVEVNGTLNANKANINKLTLNGNFEGLDIHLKEGMINGTVSLRKSKVSGIITVYGLLTASECEFSNAIMIDSTEVHFSKSTLQDINVLNSATNPTVQKIYLKENTILKGKISFKSGKGEVIISGKSTITASQVIGGKITQKD
ncbi:MAG: hypothetical protein KA146_12040, partial [Leptospiraceae bacterium]|nr:hypothetical protein [Leptospiraceae bacterium]